MKERYAITDMRKLANRMQFGIPEESSLGDGLVEGYGMLGQAGSGKLRVSMRQSKHAAKVAKKFKEKLYGSCGATSGLTSSLACTPVCRGSSSRIHRLMHTSLAVELKAPTSLRREHFQESGGSDPDSYKGSFHVSGRIRWLPIP